MFIYIIIAAILATIGTLIHYQWMLKKHQQRLYHQGRGVGGHGNQEDVLSLDEDDHGERDYSQAPTKLPMTLAIGLTVILVFYFIFFHEASSSDGSNSYEHVALRHMSEVLTANQLFKEKRTPVLLVLPPMLYRQLQSAEAARERAEGAEKEKIKDPSEIIALREVLTRANNFEIKAVRASVDLVSERSKEGADHSLRAQDLRDILRSAGEVQLVICLANYDPGAIRTQPGRRDRNYFLAVFTIDSRLTEYLDMVESGEVDLAFVSKGTYNRRDSVPDDANLDALVDKHFLRITPDNARYIRGAFRQYIGKDPFDPKDFCK